MREYNCDSLQKLPVPDELTDKALAVPDMAEPVKALPRRRVLIAAAGFVLAATVGLSVYFLARIIDSSPIPVAPISSATSAASESLSPTGEAELTEPTDAPSEAYVPTDPARPSEQPTEHTEADPAQPAEPVPQPPMSDPTAVPTVSPTAGPTPPPTDAPDITPTDPPVIIPSEEPTDPPEPWEDPTEPPTDLPRDVITSVGYMIPVSSYSGSGDIYCRLYNSAGALMGSEDLFDDSHRVFYTTGSGYLMLSYPLSSVGVPLPADSYTLVFYDENGDDFYICSAFLSRK